MCVCSSLHVLAFGSVTGREGVLRGRLRWKKSLRQVGRNERLVATCVHRV